MKRPKIVQEGKMLDYSEYFIIDAFNEGGHRPIDIKTPFGKLSKETLERLDKFWLDIKVVSKADAGYVYNVSRRKEEKSEQ